MYKIIKKHLVLLFTVLILGGSINLGYAQMICPLDPNAPKPETVTNVNQLNDIPVLHDGRVKPFQTFAESTLLQFSGKKSYQGKSASEWMAGLLFAPDTVSDDKVLLINHPQIPVALDLEPVKNRLYSYNQIQSNFQELLSLAQSVTVIEDQERGVVENEILRVYRNMLHFSQLAQVFQFAFPHPDFTVADKDLSMSLNLPRGLTEFSFLDVVLAADNIHERIDGLEKREMTSWDDGERQTIELLATLFAWSQQFRDMPFRIIPSHDQDELWYSPWDAIAHEFQYASTRDELNLWRDVVVAYWEGDHEAFRESLVAFKSSIIYRASDHQEHALDKLSLELTYNNADFFLWAKWGYLLALVAFALSLIFPSWKKLHFLAIIAIIIGAIPHAAAIITRMMIMERPPVSTLYETFIFVAFVSVLIGLIVEWIHRQWLGVIVAAISGIVLLLIASKYSMDGDTMGMLMAVLNSNFWLTTHVLTIVSGYAACCVAGIIGHVYIVQRTIGNVSTDNMQKTYNIMMGVLGFSLILTFLGTNLGGIWADQSWGRFWGWDPKENGALMIVLWTALIMHARIGKMIGTFGMAIGTVLGMMVVMWAWFGVNLLNVGLHSYGFTSGAGLGLLVYYSLEIVFLTVFCAWIQLKEINR